MEFVFEHINKKIIRLNQLSKKIGWSREAIIQILNEAGFNLPTNKPDIFLNSNHIEVLASHYVAAVKKFQSKKAEKSFMLSSNELLRARHFLRQFISKEVFEKESRESFLGDLNIDESDYGQKILLSSLKFFFSEPDELRLNLDDNLIKAYFHSIAYGGISLDGVKFRSIFKQIQAKIKRVLNDVRKKIFLLIFSNQYYIFANDEEHMREVILNNSFSIMLKKHREVLNDLIYLTELIICKKNQNKLLLSI
ncbi:MAG: hypothetical protein V4667_12905 [Bacteroidota bacterium]